LIVCVRPGVELVRANPREFVSAFSKLDLPMFERPQKATSGRLSWGKSSGCFALLTNRAELILTTHSAKGYGTNQTTSIVTSEPSGAKDF
jgi:hypothetical protein